MRSTQFIEELQKEAAAQSKLHLHRFLPQQLDGVTSFVGRYHWQVLLLLSLGTAVALRVVQGWGR